MKLTEQQRDLCKIFAGYLIVKGYANSYFDAYEKAMNYFNSKSYARSVANNFNRIARKMLMKGIDINVKTNESKKQG